MSVPAIQTLLPRPLASVRRAAVSRVPAWTAFDVFTAPGLHGSEAEHWQSAWERDHARIRRIEQDDWMRPDLDAWARRVVETLLRAPRPALVVAHSLGCLATLRAAAFQSQLIAGALLVAPANPARFEVSTSLRAGVPDFPVTMVASDNDPWLTPVQARGWAQAWGAQLHVLPGAGHINVASGHSRWSEGLQLLEGLARRVRQRR